MNQKRNLVAFNRIVTFAAILETFIVYFCSIFKGTSFYRLKRAKYHILCGRILLICFMAGQFMIYGHQHPTSSASAKQFAASGSSVPHQTVKEHCDLCDVMHHNAMLASYQVYLKPVTVASHFYKSTDYSFASIQLILAGGRAPPSSNS
jgi:hypothetical protein